MPLAAAAVGDGNRSDGGERRCNFGRVAFDAVVAD